MKNQRHLKTGLSAITSLCFIASTEATVLIVDDFSKGEINRTLDNRGRDVTDLDLEDFNRRFVEINVGNVSFPHNNFTVISDLANRNLHFSSSLREFTGRDGEILTRPSNISLSIDYLTASTPPVDIRSFSGLALSVESIQGQAEFSLFFGLDYNPIDLDKTGDAVYPFSIVRDEQFNRNEANFLTLTIRPISDDFSITINQVSLVPEPSAALLIVSGSLLLTVQRRRR